MTIKDLLISAMKNILQHKTRTILTIIAILIGTFTISLTIGINVGVNKYLDDQLGNIGGENNLTIARKTDNGLNIDNSEPVEYKDGTSQAATLTEKDINKIKNVTNIIEVTPIQTPIIEYAKSGDGKKYLLPVSTAINGISNTMQAGNMVDMSAKENQIIIAPEYVKTLGLKSNKKALGKKIKLAITSQVDESEKKIEAKVVGVLTKSLIQGGQSRVNKQLADQILAINNKGVPAKIKNSYQFLTVEVKPSTDAQTMKTVKKDLDKLGFMSQTVEDSVGIIYTVINAVTGVLTLFGMLSLFAACFGIINTLYMSVQERTREIGLMKALGMSKRKIFILFSFEAILIGFLGSLLGIVSAQLLGSGINSIASSGFLEELSGLKLVDISLMTASTISLSIMLVAFIAGTFPAEKAAKLDPIIALRHE
ncbi:putative ABC transporter permease [Brochothrix thermosphacta]|uniref:ABC transporter permease n=1 Tax=Brochothrix thermosphacta TaxID=2756 RepID=UPI000D777D4D|nr:FtsX-like permease family protein [Brochothrix thermosphacta]SPN72103.1 putative ABC transporter permease [Brochothrix thermosphacta]